MPLNDRFHPRWGWFPPCALSQAGDLQSNDAPAGGYTPAGTSLDGFQERQSSNTLQRLQESNVQET
jgi:hypothetical protein